MTERRCPNYLQSDTTCPSGVCVMLASFPGRMVKMPPKWWTTLLHQLPPLLLPRRPLLSNSLMCVKHSAAQVEQSSRQQPDTIWLVSMGDLTDPIVICLSCPCRDKILECCRPVFIRQKSETGNSSSLLLPVHWRCAMNVNKSDYMYTIDVLG